MNKFKKFDIPKMLYFHLHLYKPSQQNLMWKIKRLYKLIFSIMIKSYYLDYHYNGNKILYVDRTLTDRPDITFMLDNIFKQFNNRADRLKWGIRRKFIAKRALKNVIFCIDMFYLLKQYSFMEWVYALGLFVEMKDVGDEMDNNVDMTNYNLCFCFYDAAPYQNFLIQYAKIHGCKTATLQHGIMLSPRVGLEDNLDFAGHEFRASVSDYFLAWNEFTKNEAIKTGIEENKLKVVGISKCIGVTPPTYSPNSNKIGIILDGKFEEHNNIPLIRIVQGWAKNNGFKCIFRYHPDYKATEYEDYLDKSVSDTCKKTDSLYDFIKDISFCVVANSTVLFELEYFCIPFIRYSSNDLLDKFKDYPSVSFTSKYDFDEAYKKMMSSEKKAFVSADIKYKEFFMQFI